MQTIFPGKCTEKFNKIETSVRNIDRWEQKYIFFISFPNPKVSRFFLKPRESEKILLQAMS